MTFTREQYLEMADVVERDLISIAWAAGGEDRAKVAAAMLRFAADALTPTADGLRKWVQHTDDCDLMWERAGKEKRGRPLKGVCTCGLDAALAAAPRMEEHAHIIEGLETLRKEAQHFAVGSFESAAKDAFANFADRLDAFIASLKEQQ